MPSPPRAAIPLLALALIAACGDEPAETALQAPAAAPAPTAAARSAPAPGALSVEYRAGRVSIQCDQVPRRAVLRRLAEAAGFRLEADGLPRTKLSLRIEEAPLPAVLPQLLEGVAYRTDYEIDPETGAHRLVWLGAGRMASLAETGSPALAEAAPGARTRGESPAAFLERHRRRVAGMSPEERARIREEWNQRAEAREPELLAQLDDPDPSVRAEAVLGLPLEGSSEQRQERLERLDGLLRDPDSAVRMAVVERLGDFESPTALRSVLPALDDPNRDVVLEAITVVEDMDDASAIPHLEPLLQDRDPEIREAAEFAIEWLRW